LIIPSYEDTDFSSIRFWDALFKDCIPLIHESCNWKQAFVEHSEISKIIEDHLIVSTENIVEKVKLPNDQLLKMIQSTYDWEKLHDIGWYRSKTEEFFDSLT